MNLHFSFKSAKSPHVEKELNQHVQKLGRLLHIFRPELVHLHGTFDRRKRDSFTAALNLRLPTGQLYSEEEGQSANAAIKVAFNELLGQLKRHKELLRNEHKWRRVRQDSSKPLPSAEADAAQPASREALHGGRLAASAQPMITHPKKQNGRSTDEEITAATFAGDNRNLFQADVRHYFDANLGKLQRYITREVLFLESSGDLEPGRLRDEEVLDEVVLAALSMEERPGHISLERWLYKLARQAIRRLSTPTEDDRALHLEQAMTQQNVSGTDDAHLQYHQPGEVLQRQDVIADQTTQTPEEFVANEEFVAQLEIVLQGIHRDQREAFVLYAIEGFTIQEIAQVTDHRSEDVRMAVAAARDHVAKKLPASSDLKKKFLQYSSVA